jgi:hypothetical protein
MQGRASVPDFAAGIDKCTRSVNGYIAEGMPCDYIGRTPYPIVDEALEWLRNRKKRLSPPRGRGRPAGSTLDTSKPHTSKAKAAKVGEGATPTPA